MIDSNKIYHGAAVKSNSKWYTCKATGGSALPPVDWDRWDELRNKRRLGGLTPDEDREYERSARVVAVLDALEAARAERAVDLLEKHKRVVASLDRLAKAVRTAAEQL